MTRSYMGMIDDLPNEEYHSSPGISKSHLDTIAGKSPAHYWAKYLDPNREPEAPTPAKILGSAIHSAILEPDLFPSEYVPNPGIDRRTNAGKAEWAAFQVEQKGKVILSDDEYQKCLKIRDAVHHHPLAAGLLTRGKAEQSFYALEPDTGELIKCRTDYMHDDGGMIVDLKTTEDASPFGFGKSAANYRYDLQPPWYLDVLEILYGEVPRYWAFLAIEKDPPYAIGIYYATPDQIERGRIIARRDFDRIIAQKQLGQWPDYGTEILPLEMPAWAKR